MLSRHVIRVYKGASTRSSLTSISTSRSFHQPFRISRLPQPISQRHYSSTSGDTNDAETTPAAGEAVQSSENGNSMQKELESKNREIIELKVNPPKHGLIYTTNNNSPPPGQISPLSSRLPQPPRPHQTRRRRRPQLRHHRLRHRPHRKRRQPRPRPRYGPRGKCGPAGQQQRAHEPLSGLEDDG